MILKVAKRGANVPKNVAFAILVIFNRLKNNAKCIPSKMPAIKILLRLLLLFTLPCLKNKLYSPKYKSCNKHSKMK